MRTFYLFAFLFTLLPLQAAEQKPNIVLFFIDDLGWADIGANGSSFYETPNIDQLAKDGVQFTQAYSAHPVCSPTRASLQTGKAPQRLGITNWISSGSSIHLPLEETTLAEALRDGGYRTGYIGKWHLGKKEDWFPQHQGYDWVRCVNNAGEPGSYFFPYKRRKGTAWDVPDLDDGAKGDYLTDAITEKALEFIDIESEKPFFLNFSHYAVHTPIQAPKTLVNKYKKKQEKLWGKEQTPAVPDRDNTSSRGRQDHPTYAAMMENLDQNIARVVQHLESKNLLENTLIIFTSDNGGHCHGRKPGYTSNLPLRSGKGWNYEGGIRVPTIYYWEGKLAPRKVDTPTITNDIYPTLLEISGLPPRPKQHLDGSSIVPALYGKSSASLDDRLLGWHYPHTHGSGHPGSTAIRKGDWKLIRFQKGTRYELYNLADDLAEKNNLAEAIPERVKELEQSMDNWLKKTIR